MESTPKTAKATAHSASPRASAGPDGVSIAPPTHGTRDIERVSAQMSATPPEASTPTGPQALADQRRQEKTWRAVQRKQTDGKPTASAVIQRWEWPWNWGKKKEQDRYADLSASDRRNAEYLDAIAQQEREHDLNQNEIGGPSFQYASYMDVYNNRESARRFHARADMSLQTPSLRSKAEKSQAVSSGVSKLGTFVTHAGQVRGNDALGTTGRITGGVGGGLGAVGSLFEASLETHDIITSYDKKKDKAIRSVGVLGPLSNAASSAASGVKQVSGLMPGTAGTLSSIAGAVAAPAAIAKGGADVITGLATGGLAHYRSNRLQEMEERGAQRGIARFAKESQWNKAKSNYGKAAGGALSVAGGALLLAVGLSNPIGWGLLAGAGLIGLGLTAYKMYKKHQQGKQLQDPAYQGALARNNINVPDDAQLGPGGLGNIFKTKSMRRQDAVRGLIAARLAESEHGNRNLSEIGGHLGVSALDDQHLPLSDQKRDEQKAKRARSYARALDY